MDKRLLRKILAENVRKRRKKLGLSQEGLAERADMHWTYISGVERCRYNVSIDTLARFAAVFRCHPADLLKD